MTKIAIIIPCYKEKLRIEKTVNVYFDYFSKNHDYHDKKVIFVLVDDGSPDGTLDILKSFESQSTDKVEIKAIGYSENQGKGAAIKYGCASVEADIYGFVDADLSFESTSLDLAIRKTAESDLVLGQRSNNATASHYANFRQLISITLRRAISFLSGLPVMDTQCGLKFFSRQVAREILPQVKENRFAFDLEFILLVKKNKLSIFKLPLNYQGNDQSSVTWKDGFRYLFDTVGIIDRVTKVNVKKLWWNLILIGLLTSFIVYGWVIFKGYLFSDDFTWLWHGQKINNSLINILTFRMSTFYSPVMNAFYSLVYSLFEFTVKPLFFFGIMVNSIVASLSGFLAWQLSKSRLVALVIAFLSAFAGIAYEPIVWVSANMHSVVTLFIISALVLLYQYLEDKKWWWLIGSFGSYILALGTKESAIVTPALMLIVVLFYYLKNKNKGFLSIATIVFGVGVFITSVIYLYQQFLWQKNSIWVASEVWSLKLSALFRVPLIILDNFFPISFFTPYLNNFTAFVLSLIALFIIGFILYKFRKLRLVWLGMTWLIITISPFIFFQTTNWWLPLASRYNYLPRFGALLILVVILHYLIVNNKARYIINGFIVFIGLSIVMQISFMAIVVNQEYDYVYRSGQTLAQAMTEIEKINPDKIYVMPDRPFEGNQAHIIGLAEIMTGINEDQVYFLSHNEEIDLPSNSVLLYWDPSIRSYLVK